MTHHTIGEDRDSSCVHHTTSCMSSILGAIRLGGWDELLDGKIWCYISAGVSNYSFHTSSNPAYLHIDK